jgi:FtsH-binding integral membrane protein
MNTLAYADVTDEQASSASTIASTMQQMSISFGVATASLATAFFIPDRFHTSAPEMIHGIHQAFLVLGGLTVLSTLVFYELKSDDVQQLWVAKTPSRGNHTRSIDAEHGK